MSEKRVLPMPERIWMADGREEEFERGQWVEHQDSDFQVEYIRADRHEALLSALTEIVEAHEKGESAAKRAIEKGLAVEFRLAPHLQKMANVIQSAARILGEQE